MSLASISNKAILLITTCFLSIAPKLCAEEAESGNWVISADFLAWFASEEASAIWADVVTIGDNTSSWNAKSFNFDWDYGFRVGTGYDFVYDQWDTNLNWTWYRTDAKHEVPYVSNGVISPEFFAGFLSYERPQTLSAKWNLLLNMFDWELGRNISVSKELSFRPFIGVKGGWINQSLDASYSNLTINSNLTSNSAHEHLTNNFWGVGPLGGINTLWRVRHFKSNSFNFFGDFSLATMWGNWSFEDLYKSTLPYTSSVNTSNLALGALMFRGFMGIEWNVDFNGGKSRFATKLGYEMQFWANQLRIATFQIQRSHGDLTLQGITLNCRFDF